MMGVIGKLATVILILFATGIAGAAENNPPQAGEPLPQFELPLPDNSVDLQYLGLPAGGKTFRPEQIKAKLIILQIFNMYCPHCQEDAPNVNRLFASFEKDPTLKNKVKFVGIGIKNTNFEVNLFKKKYKVAFPLFPDKEGKIYKLMGEGGTPYFFVVKLTVDGRPEIIYSHLGALKGIELTLLEELIHENSLK